MSEITRRNREKRKADRLSISVNSVNDKGEDYSLLDSIPSDFDTFEEVSKRQENGEYRDKVQQYISKLSNQQVNILNLLIDGYKPFEVRRILEMSPKEYADNVQIMRCYGSVKDVSILTGMVTFPEQLQLEQMHFVMDKGLFRKRWGFFLKNILSLP